MSHRHPVSPTRRRQRGNSLIEFSLVSIFMVPMFLGTISTGVALGKFIQVAQVARDAGHMFVRQVDFSQDTNKQIIERIAIGLNMTVSGGNGVVILSRVQMIGAAECALVAAGSCNNLNNPVITQRITIGNSTLLTSPIGNPPGNVIQADGTILPSDYLTNTSLRASTLSTGGPNPVVGQLTLANGELSYIAEAYFTIPELSFLNRGNAVNIYSRNYF